MKNYFIPYSLYLIPKNVLFFVFWLLILSFSSCKTVEYKYIPIKEIHTEEIIVRDTIIDIQLIPYKDSVSLHDTISYLENTYAYSYVLFSLGKLHHSLGIKEVKIPADVQLVEKIIRDSIPYPVEVKGETVIRYKRGFFWWSGVVACVILFGVIVFKLSRFLL